MNRSESFSKAAQHVIYDVDALAQKIVVHDDRPVLERLRQGDFAETPLLLDPFFQDAIPRLAEYDHHIALLEEAFQKLKGARDGFKHSVDMRRSMLAPVRRLPADVLVEIFSLYIQDCGLLRRIDGRIYSLALLGKHLIFSPSFTLSHVCSFWRRVAFSKSTFWSSFALDLKVLGAFEGATKLTDTLSECLSRSANAQLSLYIKFDDFDCEDVLDLFLKQAARWEHLDLFFPYRSMSRFISQLQSGEQPPIFSNLRHLNIKAEGSCDRLSIFLRSSRLETLSTGSLEVPWSEFCQWDFSSLKKLETLRLSGGSVGQFFGRMSSLEVCKLASTSGFTAREMHTNTPYFSNLRRLSVYLDSCPVDAWQSLRTPHLGSLSLQAGGSAKLRHIEDFSLMLVRSKCVLQKLTLYNFHAREAVNLVSTHPSLTEITLSGIHRIYDRSEFPGNLFSRFTILKDGNETILGPNLQSLTIQIEGHIIGAEYSRALAQDIVEMVISRADADSLPSGASALQKFSLTMETQSQEISEEVFRHIWTSLTHLVDYGLQLDIDQHIFTFSHL